MKKRPGGIKPDKIILTSLLLPLMLFNLQSALAQTQKTRENMEEIKSANSFTGAKAVKKHYYAIYQLNTDNPGTIQATLRNINNAMNDPRLKRKLEVELVAFSGGWEVFNKDNSYGEKLLELKKKGVILAQCENTLEERKIPKSQILPFVSFVPSGNGELIIRESQGWAIVKP